MLCSLVDIANVSENILPSSSEYMSTIQRHIPENSKLHDQCLHLLSGLYLSEFTIKMLYAFPVVHVFHMLCLSNSFNLISQYYLARNRNYEAPNC